MLKVSDITNIGEKILTLLLLIGFLFGMVVFGAFGIYYILLIILVIVPFLIFILIGCMLYEQPILKPLKDHSVLSVVVFAISLGIFYFYYSTFFNWFWFSIACNSLTFFIVVILVLVYLIFAGLRNL
ncbi:hypothetical protein B6U67_03215 [Methanosarcinales archaeon ex4484_138]|nr:MAG: hypothetical protein B6U67_03215 [Methanosarcinales archaeon ex4484_138]